MRADNADVDVREEVEAVIRLLRLRGGGAELMALLKQIIALKPDEPRYECVLDYDPVLLWHRPLDRAWEKKDVRR